MRREPPVAVWVGMKAKAGVSTLTEGIPTFRKKREGRAIRTEEDKPRTKRGRFGRTMDITWLDEDKRIAVGGAIWDSIDKMAQVHREGITHIIDMQSECDDTEVAEPFGIQVLWNETDDDFLPKPAKLFRRGVDFARKAFEERPDAKLFIHCAAGVHRAPMMALAVLCSMDAGSLKRMDVHDAMQLIEEKRPVADFADVYVESVRAFLAGRE